MHLTEEQKKIIGLVALKWTNSQIAEEVGFSEASIKRRLKVIYKGLRMDRIDLIVNFKKT